MKKLLRCPLLILTVLVLLSPSSDASAQSPVITYPFPSKLAVSKRFHVSVAGEPVFTHAAAVADFAMFAIRGRVQVTVACDQAVTSAVIRPRSRNIRPTWEAQTVRFTVEDATNIRFK